MVVLIDADADVYMVRLASSLCELMLNKFTSVPGTVPEQEGGRRSEGS